MEIITENDEYFLTEIPSLIGSETASTRRSRKSRGQKALQCNTGATPCNLLQQNCNGDIEIDKEIDIELEKEEELKGQALARSYGRYENVFLTDTELSELQAELPEKWAYYIERLSGYIASTGKKYKNHAATIRRWAADDTAKAAPKQGIPEYTCKEGESL